MVDRCVCGKTPKIKYYDPKPGCHRVKDLCYVICECGLKTPKVTKMEDAIKLWNKQFYDSGDI